MTPSSQQSFFLKPKSESESDSESELTYFIIYFLGSGEFDLAT